MRRLWPILALVVVAACTSDTDPGTTTSEAAVTTTVTSVVTTTTLPATTEDRLDELDGALCPDSDFTCVAIEVPLDHFGSGDETIEVTFAVLPATGQRRGVFVTATGGPGTAGIAYADSYTSVLDPAIAESFDVVFFDQRGVGLSGGLTCPEAATVYYRVDPSTGIGFDEEGLTSAALDFADDCVAEMGDVTLLPYLATAQVVEDIEAFREVMGYETMVIYGESYGTQVAQTYAAAHGDALERMVIDGVVDLTLDGPAFFRDQAQAFGDTLQASFDACIEDPWCAADFGTGSPDAAYDRLVALLVEEPLSGEYPLPDGTTVTRTFGLGDLELVAAGQVYGETDRSIFLRALAAHYDRDDLLPLLRLLYLNLGVDPADETLVADETWSDAIYYAVECLEYHFPGATPAEKATGFFANGDGFETQRLGSIVLGDLPCAFWPHVSDDPARPEPLAAPGVPTVVLGSTADPATPYQHGLNVLAHLEEGYLVTQIGGPHVIFGRGNDCPDIEITAFILEGEAPTEDECEGYVIDYYAPLFPTTVTDFEGAESFLWAIEDEIIFLPEYWYWSGLEPTAAGCAHGGTLSMTPTDTGYGFNFDDCAIAPDAILGGEASYDVELDSFVLEITVGEDDCRFSYERRGEEIVNVDDQCDAYFDPPDQ